METEHIWGLDVLKNQSECDREDSMQETERPVPARSWSLQWLRRATQWMARSLQDSLQPIAYTIHISDVLSDILKSVVVFLSTSIYLKLLQA